MTIRVSYFVPPAQLETVRAVGLLDDLDVIEQRTSGSEEQLAGLVAGEIDVVVTAIDNLFEWQRQGADLKLVGQLEATMPLRLFGASDIRSLDDLAGKPFAVDAMANGFALVARYLLAEAEIDTNFVPIGGVAERFEALLAGEISGTLLGPPFDARAEQAGLIALIDVPAALPGYPGQGLFVRADRYRDPDMQRFLAALKAHGLLPVEQQGIDLLTNIRTQLGAFADPVAFASALLNN